MSWAAEKTQWYIPIGLWVLRPWYFYFCFVFWSGYFTLKKIKDISPTNDDKIYAVKTDFVSQVYVIRTKIHIDRIHWNCLALQQSTSSSHPFFHPKPRNCSHQIDPFPAHNNNASNACLCVLPPALLNANWVSPLNETLFQSTHRQMKCRLAHCT